MDVGPQMAQLRVAVSACGVDADRVEPVEAMLEDVEQRLGSDLQVARVDAAARHDRAPPDAKRLQQRLDRHALFGALCSHVGSCLQLPRTGYAARAEAHDRGHDVVANARFHSWLRKLRVERHILSQGGADRFDKRVHLRLQPSEYKPDGIAILLLVHS